MGPVLLIGLTGGIASGKSLVAARLAELGAHHIDADLLAREVVAPGTDGLREIAEAFGTTVLQPDGSLDRAALGSIVFSDPEARATLNEITHPRVRDLVAERVAQAEAADPDAIVIYDVPLLAESTQGNRLQLDSVVVVHSDTEDRIRRMVEDRGMSREEAMHRINSQSTDSERLAIADVVLDNHGTREALLAQVDELWSALLSRSQQSKRS
ncbi:dephospho-CoA kinase [Salinibacterium hongtaonis]|uniref:dephospho-CoA kinase n=1 Tax=Homoserinimonas hongtaonis TaxID=2079791 RepID=UPI003BB12CA6